VLPASLAVANHTAGERETGAEAERGAVMGGSEMGQQKLKWYASLFVGWAGSFGRTSWTADVVGDGREVDIQHRHVTVCENGSCPLADGLTPLPDYNPIQAIDHVQNERNALIRARLPHEGEPVVSDVLIDQLGDFDHLLALTKACTPVWAKVACPSIWPLVVAAMMGVAVAAAAALYFFGRLVR
jgi:hypothetical protein